MGFTSTASDPRVHTKGSGNNYTMLTISIDDLIIAGPSNASVADVRNMLSSRYATTDLGDVTQIMGIEVQRNKEAGTIEGFNSSD